MARMPVSLSMDRAIVRGLFLGFLMAMSLAALPARADEPDIVWQHRAFHGNVTVTANPLGIESRTSFYLGRGFTAESIQTFARSCGFSIGMHNAGSRPITTRLADWRAIGADGRDVPFRQPAAWDADWERLGVPQAARIAFRWAQFQSENNFAPGDWIMGMAALKEVPAAPFRLVARYHDNKGDHEIVLDGLGCARD